MKLQYFSSIVLSVLLFTCDISAQISSVASGNWNSATTWSGGVVPSATSNVTITSGVTVTLDAAAAEVCNNLTVSGSLLFINDGSAGNLTVNGNLLVNSGGILKSPSRSTAVLYTATPTVHSLMIKGNLTNAGTFDMREGTNGASGSTNQTTRACNVTFSGTTNSVLLLSQTAYGSSLEEFNAITIDKSAGAKVIISTGNLFMTNNSSVAPATLTFTNGMIETGSNYLVALSTSNSTVVGASATKYVNGNLGRGLSTSAAANRVFDIGDATGYRPVTVSTTTTVASGGYIVANVISGNANTGSSTFPDATIDKVSKVRYYQITFKQSVSATTSVNVCKFTLSYGVDDGVGTGNTDLRVAYSNSNRANWFGMPQTKPHTTDLTNPPTLIAPDSLLTAITLTDGASVFATLARAAGTTTNTLEFSTDIQDNSVKVHDYTLEQNYPNPFNPSTIIRFTIAKEQNVALTVYDALGKEIKTLINESYKPGTYGITFNASGLTSGMYMYVLRTNNNIQTKKMVLIK